VQFLNSAFDTQPIGNIYPALKLEELDSQQATQAPNTNALFKSSFLAAKIIFAKLDLVSSVYKLTFRPTLLPTDQPTTPSIHYP
jgi:hypothetical protein